MMFVEPRILNRNHRMLKILRHVRQVDDLPVGIGKRQLLFPLPLPVIDIGRRLPGGKCDPRNIRRILYDRVPSGKRINGHNDDNDQEPKDKNLQQR